MTEDRTGAGPDDFTHSWAFGAPVDAYQLSVEDQQVIAQLRPGTAMLVGVGGPVIGSRLLLSHAEVRVGRNEDCLVWLPARSVSRHHATLVRHDEGYELVDAGSLNGSWVDHRLVERRLLRHGDEVQFGGCRFLFVEGGSATAGG
ncbi:MAG: FHA domain-containing protein [Actinomycetes bacterium]